MTGRRQHLQNAKRRWLVVHVIPYRIRVKLFLRAYANKKRQYHQQPLHYLWRWREWLIWYYQALGPDLS